MLSGVNAFHTDQEAPTLDHAPQREVISSLGNAPVEHAQDDADESRVRGS